MTKWTAPDIASIRGDNSRPLQKIFGSLTEYLKDYQDTIDTASSSSSQTFVRNGEATTLTIGTVVYLDAQQGDRATVKRAFNTSDATSAKTLGVVAENIPANSDGLVTTLGYVYKCNTSGYTAGQTLYLGATAGTFTATKPHAPNHMVYVGVVVRANAGNGIIYVRCQNGYELDEIHDVLITSPTAGQTLSYDAVTSLWKNATFSDGGGLTNLNASNLASGTVPTGRMTGAYTGITGLGTLTSLTIDGSGSPSFTLGDTGFAGYSGLVGDKGYLLLGNSVSDPVMYLRTSGAGPVYLGAANSNTLQVGNGTATVAGTMNATTFSGALSGNASTATNLSTDRSNWSTNGTISATVGQLAWKNYGNSHTIFDASAQTSPSGTAVNNTNAQIAWTSSYPTLMGWNGASTYGVRVDSARISDTATKAGSLGASGLSGTAMTFHWSGQGGQPNWLWGGSDGSNMYVYNPSNFNVNSATTATNQSGGTVSATYLTVTGGEWLRTSSQSGWYNSTYATGIYSKATREVWTYNASRFIASNNSSSGAYSAQQLEVRSNDLSSGGTVAGISFHVYGANAPVLRYWTGTGAGLDVNNEGGTGYWYMGASNFVTRSSMRWKTDIRRRPKEQIVEVGLRLLEGETAIWDSKDIEPIFDEENECYVQPSAEQRELVKDDWIQRRHFNKRGYIVEELEKVFPEAVHYESDGKPSGVDYGVITTELVDILKLVVLQNDDQQRRIELLEKKRK